MRRFAWAFGLMLLGAASAGIAQEESTAPDQGKADKDAVKVEATEAGAEQAGERSTPAEMGTTDKDAAKVEATEAGAATTPAGGGTEAAREEAIISAEAGGGTDIGLAAVPTHWKAEKPVGKGAGPVTPDMLRQTGAKTDEWLLYGGDYRNTRHSPVKSLNPETVGKLQMAWAFPTGTLGQFAVSPVLYDGVLYVTSPYNRLFALDPKTGTPLWRYDHKQPADLRLCCGPANRGVAISGDNVYMGTLDAKLIAFDRRTGEIVWQTEVVSYKDGFSITSAPLAVGDLLYMGVAGGEFGVRGFLDAYDAKTGKRVWRLNTVPDENDPAVKTWEGNSWKTGGAPTWNTGTYDPESDTLFWAVGNPSPDWNGDLRDGDNLYSNSVLAIEPKTGKMKGYFQFTPHDVWDYDGNTHFFLIDIPYQGRTLKALVQPNRNGFYYILDRESGKYLQATQYVDQLNWAKGIDSNGRPIVDPTKVPTENPQGPQDRICPSNLGGLNGAFTPAYDPSTNLVFVPMMESCQLYKKGIVAFVKGIPFMGGLPVPYDGMNGKSYGNFKAIDASTGKIVWTYRDPKPMWGGTLATAGGVAFTSNVGGDALAFESKTGRELWRFRMGGAGRSQPIAFELDGEPYVVFGSGGFATLESFGGVNSMIPEGAHLFVFKVSRDALGNASGGERRADTAPRQ